MEISKELKEKAKACKTVEELVALAKSNDIELSAEEADLLLKDFAEGEIADSELDNIAGGTDGCVKPGNPYDDHYYVNEEDVEFIFNVGDTVQAFGDFLKHHTATCKITARKAERNLKVNRLWYDVYYLEKVPGCHTPFTNGWGQRSNIEK